MLKLEDFKPHVGKIFHFKGTPFAFPLDHIASNRKRLPKSVKRRPFTLVFRGPRTAQHLPEGMYECEVEGGPTYSIYVIPIQTIEPEFQDYQAIFN
jgi:hypothetical protein